MIFRFATEYIPFLARHSEFIAAPNQYMQPGCTQFTAVLATLVGVDEEAIAIVVEKIGRTALRHLGGEIAEYFQALFERWIVLRVPPERLESTQ